jgi:hypothetical protein
MKNENTKKLEKKMAGTSIYSHWLELFKRRCNSYAGDQSQQFSAAIMVYMALQELDPGLAARFVNPGISLEHAIELLSDGMRDISIRRAIAGMPDPEAAKMLLKIKESPKS